MADSDSAIAHGGGLIAARARFPGAPVPWIDLSTGINPMPYPVAPLRPETFHRLPEPEEVRRLETAAARAYGVADPRMVVAAPGTQILISLLPRLLRLGSVAVVGHTYAEHAAAWAAAGTSVSVVAGIRSLGGQPGVVLCNPNNPDGRRTRDTDLLALAAQVGAVVVDEAFADLEDPGLSLAPQLPGNAIVLRSFGKTYGLAGLRLGFAVAAPAMAHTIRAALGPWAVSSAAVEIGTAALADSAWLAATRVRLDRNVARLDDLLTEAGLRVIGGTRLFRLASLSADCSSDNPHPDPLPQGERVRRYEETSKMFNRLGRAGILVRRFDAEPAWLRFGIPGGGWNRVEAALGRPDPQQARPVV